MPQQVFVSSLASSICCEFSAVHVGKRRASASVSPLVAPSAIQPGRKQTRRSIFGDREPPMPLGSSATMLSFACLVGTMRCFRMPARASSHISRYTGTDVCRYCLIRYSAFVSYRNPRRCEIITIIRITPTSKTNLGSRELTESGARKSGTMPSRTRMSSTTFMIFSTLRQYMSLPVMFDRYFISSCNDVASAVDEAPPSE
jgi:hypothetical protein